MGIRKKINKNEENASENTSLRPDIAENNADSEVTPKPAKPAKEPKPPKPAKEPKPPKPAKEPKPSKPAKEPKPSKPAKEPKPPKPAKEPKPPKPAKEPKPPKPAKEPKPPKPAKEPKVKPETPAESAKATPATGKTVNPLKSARPVKPAKSKSSKKPEIYVPPIPPMIITPKSADIDSNTQKETDTKSVSEPVLKKDLPEQPKFKRVQPAKSKSEELKSEKENTATEKSKSEESKSEELKEPKPKEKKPKEPKPKKEKTEFFITEPTPVTKFERNMKTAYSIALAALFAISMAFGVISMSVTTFLGPNSVAEFADELDLAKIATDLKIEQKILSGMTDTSFVHFGQPKIVTEKKWIDGHTENRNIGGINYPQWVDGHNQITETIVDADGVNKLGKFGYGEFISEVIENPRTNAVIGDVMTNYIKALEKGDYSYGYTKEQIIAMMKGYEDTITKYIEVKPDYELLYSDLMANYDESDFQLGTIMAKSGISSVTAERGLSDILHVLLFSIAIVAFIDIYVFNIRYIRRGLLMGGIAMAAVSAILFGVVIFGGIYISNLSDKMIWWQSVEPIMKSSMNELLVTPAVVYLVFGVAQVASYFVIRWLDRGSIVFEGETFEAMEKIEWSDRTRFLFMIKCIINGGGLVLILALLAALL